MDLNTLFTNSLSYFMVLYKMRSFTKAAAIIPISTQGLHKSISTLEKTLDVNLFVNTNNGQIAPTPQADELYSLAQSWLSDIHILRNSLDALRNQSKTTIHLLAARGTLGFLGFGVTEAFQKRFSNYLLDITEHYDFIVEEMLMEGLYDLAISTPPQNDKFDYIPLGMDTSCIWVNKDHPLAKQDQVTLEDLDGLPVIATTMKNLAGEFFDEQFQEKGVIPQSFIHSTDLFYNFIYALNGKAVGIGLTYLSKQLSAIDEVVSIPLIDGYKWRFGLVFRKGYAFTKEDQILISFLKEHAFAACG